VTSVFRLTVRPPTPCHALSLHDALPIWARGDELAAGPAKLVPGEQGLRTAGLERRLGLWPFRLDQRVEPAEGIVEHAHRGAEQKDRKSTRLNSSHVKISYAVFCLKKKTK